MNRFTAENLMKELLMLGESLNMVAARIEQVDIDEQKRALRRGISDVMGAVYSDLMRPVIREYPDLDPDA